MIDNGRHEIKNKNGNETDEIEASGHITLEAFKNWICKSYVDMDNLIKIIIKNDMIGNNFSDENVNLILM